jgi:hypothetical protein
MKESDFWMSVAKKIEDGEQIGKSKHNRYGTKRFNGGLCFEIGYNDFSLDASVRLDKYRPAKSVAYFFPLTPKGDRKRFRLCLKMAREAEREERRNDLEGTMQR